MRETRPPYPPVSVPETLASPGIVDVWCRGDDPAGDASLDLLSPGERERWGRFRFEEDRRTYLAAHVLLRTALSAYADVSPAAWRFETGPHGKPSIGAPTLPRPLHFNLAHTRGLVACAVSLAFEHIGVDVERLDRRIDVLGLASRYFAPGELASLQALAPPRRAGRFFTYWTLKESYLKARGLGLTLPLDQAAFSTSDAGVRIAFGPRLDDEADSWRFAAFDLGPEHKVAVAANTGAADWSLRVTPA
jgi:4'-phosphopantetheinyl transferase